LAYGFDIKDVYQKDKTTSLNPIVEGCVQFLNADYLSIK